MFEASDRTQQDLGITKWDPFNEIEGENQYLIENTDDDGVIEASLIRNELAYNVEIEVENQNFIPNELAEGWQKEVAKVHFIETYKLQHNSK